MHSCTLSPRIYIKKVLEYSEFPKIYKNAEQASKSGKKSEWELQYITVQYIAFVGTKYIILLHFNVMMYFVPVKICYDVFSSI